MSELVVGYSNLKSHELFNITLVVMKNRLYNNTSDNFIKL